MKLYNLIIFIITIFLTSIAYGRCAVCVAKGMSGASIAVLIIISIFIILAIANWGLKRILNKN